jgi:hypothetical protein
MKTIDHHRQRKRHRVRDAGVCGPRLAHDESGDDRNAQPDRQPCHEPMKFLAISALSVERTDHALPGPSRPV